MFLDREGWPPPPDGGEPEPRRRAMSAREERWLMALIGLVLIAVFIGPFAGSSVVSALVAIARPH